MTIISPRQPGRLLADDRQRRSAALDSRRPRVTADTARRVAGQRLVGRATPAPLARPQAARYGLTPSASPSN